MGDIADMYREWDAEFQGTEDVLRYRAYVDGENSARDGAKRRVPKNYSAYASDWLQGYDSYMEEEG